MTGFLRHEDISAAPAAFGELLRNASIEVMPRTAAKIDDFRPLLQKGSRVYIAHIRGTSIDEMVETARRLTNEGFQPMPHLPARIVPSHAALELWARRYREEAGVTQALLLGGGVAEPAGPLDSSIAMLETGIFDRLGYKRLHVAGHPEGNKDIDVDGGTLRVDDALQWKQAFSERTDAAMAIVTQFAFDSAPVIRWAERLQQAGICMPIHVGVAGPTKLQTLIKFAIACGVGPSLSVLQKRALDLRKLLVPHEPNDLMTDLASYKVTHPESLIEQLHLFPLGGIQASTDWLARMQGEAGIQDGQLA
ncbi:MAG TPA: methylenetetrahydrofolate reductase [Pseudorhizobium sp.]|nr:methylenetetrahydrofolate reductase [Pseudorhizobium sp.]